MKRPLLFAAMTMLSAALFAQPSNDLCSGSINITVDAACISGTTINAGTEDPTINSTDYPSDVWYSFTATSTQSVVYVYPDMALDPDIYIFDNCGGNVIGFGAAGLTAGVTDSVSFATSIGTTYYISVVGWVDNPYGNFCVEVLNTVAPIQPYDPCVDYTTIQVSDPCYADASNPDTLVKSLYFIATSTTTKVQMDIYSPFQLCGVYVLETGCGGTVVFDGTITPGTIVGNQYTVEFPTTIGMDYLLYPFSSDAAISTLLPMDYCVDLIEVLGINDLSSDLLEVYPNPATTEFTVNTKNSTGNLEVIDMTGRIVRTEKINSLSTTIFIQDLNAGIYSVRYTDGTSTTSLKLIKK